MIFSISFIILDVLCVTPVVSVGLPDSINPFWKFAFIFKCFTDTIILDDFKTALDRLKQYTLERIDTGTGAGAHGRQNTWVQLAKPNKMCMDKISLQLNYWTA